MKTYVFINPKAGNGKTSKLWPELSKKIQFLRPYEEVYTQRAGHLTELTKEVLKKGAQKILVVGGDGSLAEALNGFFEEGKALNPEAWLGALPLGSGSDFLKSFGIFDLETAIQRLQKNESLTCDIGEITYSNLKGKEETKLFLNISSFGCAGEIVNQVNRSSKFFGATLTYLGITLTTYLAFRAPKVYLKADQHKERAFKVNNVFVCNGKYSGGGMCWGPKAAPQDGLLDVTVVQDIPKLQGILSMRRVYDGHALEVEGVERIQCQTMEATSKEKVLIEVDGDTVGTLPALFRIFPQKVSLWL